MAKATETPEFRRWLRWLVADVIRRQRNSPPTESDGPQTNNGNGGKVQP